MRILIFLFATTIIVVAAEKQSSNSTVAAKTKETRDKRNLNVFENFASRRQDGYNYQPSSSGYNYEPSNYIAGGSAPSSQSYQHYQEAPEPIIEIIIQDNNETLPPLQPIVLPSGKKKKEQVQVFYVKYQKDEKSGLIIHDPIPALTPAGHQQDAHDDEYDEPIIVTPIPLLPQKSTTLRTIIRPESEQYESSSGVHVTFGSAHNHHSKSDNHVHDEEKHESAIRPVIQLPQNRAGPAPVIKEKRQDFHSTQGRVVNGAQSNSAPQQQPSFQHHQQSFRNQGHQSISQGLPHQRPPHDFNQNNFVVQPGSGPLSHHLTLPNHPAKPFHPNVPTVHQAPRPQPQQPIPIPVHHQFNQQFPQQNTLVQPQRIPSGQLQSQPVLRPPQRTPVASNFNQNQRPFNYHAQQAQNAVRFPNPATQHQPVAQQQQFQNRPTQQFPPRQSSPPNFHSQNQQLPPLNRPVIPFNSQQFNNQPQHQQLPSNQGPPPNFRPNQELTVQPIHQHNQQLHQNNQQNVFRGGLIEQAAPNLSNNNFQSQEDVHVHQQQHEFIKQNFGSNVQVQSSVPKFEHHITETINAPVFYQPTAVDMDKLHQQQKHTESQHRFSVNNQQQQNGGISNHFSQVFPQVENKQKEFASQSFLELNGRNNFSPESRITSPPTSTFAPRIITTTRKPPITTTPKPVPSSTKRPASYQDLPDEVPDDLREQLLSSGILENAQISILDYDKIGATSLQDLPQEHLANFFNAGGGSQIGESNKIISVLKPNGDSVDDKIHSLKNDKEVTKFLGTSKKLPAKKEDVNLKVVRFDAQSQRNIPGQYIQQDSKILPSVNVNQNSYNRYLPLKINGAQFPIPDVEELRGKKISSVVVLAPVNSDEEDDEGRYERDTMEAKQIKFLSGELLKTLVKKPSSENFKRWLEREQKTNPELQSVILLVTRDNITDEQEIFMYDVVSKTVNRLNGELSSKFVNVAEDNATAQDENGNPITEQIDRIDENLESNEDAEAESSNIVETIAKFEDSLDKKDENVENHVLINSGYSVIKNE